MSGMRRLSNGGREKGSYGNLLLGCLAVAAGAALLPLIPSLGDRNGIGILTTIALTMCLSLSWNIVGGLTGQLSIGHAVFFGCGAYGAALLHINNGLHPLLGGLVGVVVAVVLSVLLAYLALRTDLSHLNFSLVTAAFSLVVLFFVQSSDFLGGAFGLIMPVDDGVGDLKFTDGRIYYWMFLVLALVILSVTLVIRRSKLGAQFVAVREDSVAAAGLGIPVMRVKLTAMAVSAAFTAVVGTFYAPYLRFLDPDSVFGFNRSLDLLIPAILGGTGFLLGPVVGAVVYVLADEFARTALGFEGSSGIVLGTALVLIMLYRPGGLVSIGTLLRRRRSQGRLVGDPLDLDDRPEKAEVR